MRLREMPEDVRQIILSEQSLLKQSCDCQRSLEFTVYNLIRRAVAGVSCEKPKPKKT